MVGGAEVWQRLETFTGIIEGHPHQDPYEDEKDPNNFWLAAHPGKDGKVGDCGCQRPSLIMADFLNFHSMDEG